VQQQQQLVQQHHQQQLVQQHEQLAQQQQQQQQQQLVQQQQESSPQATAVVVGTGTVPSSLSKEASREYTSDRSMYDLVRGEERKDILLKGRAGQVVNTGVQRDKRLNAQKSRDSEKRNEKVQQKRILSFINFKVETDSADSVQVISEGLNLEAI
jgi:hypothetical protein